MVTTLKPDTNRTNAGYSHNRTTEIGQPEYGEAEMEKFLNEVYGNPDAGAPQRASQSGSLNGNSSFLAGVARPLLAVYQLIAGPPMTQRDRYRHAITEARTRSTASLNWFQRTPW